MNGTLSGARLVTVAGLIAGALGMVVQRVSGVAMPVLPPGLVLLVGSALLIAYTGLRWAPALGALVGLAEAVAVVMTGQLAVLADWSAPGVFLGTWLRTAGVVVALVAGVMATVAAYRPSKDRRVASGG